MFLFCMFDTVSKQFTPIFEQSTPASAVRAIKKDARIMESLDDFQIFPLGEKIDMSGMGDAVIPLDFDWSSVLSFDSKPRPISLRAYLGLDKAD